MNVSFSGCGFLGIYYVGVASAIREYAPSLVVNKIAGASAGAIAACCLICDCCLGQGTSDVLKVVIQARSTALGPMHPSFRLIKILREGLRKILPKNAHELATDRLFVSLTRFTDGENVLVSHFDTREELIQALICSCFIPFYCGTVPPSFKGVRYIDGGWSDNLPVLDGDTITVSPFSGESDICPADADSASYLCFNLRGTSVRFTSGNLYRFAVALFPPHPEEMSKMCRQGFEDALHYLARNGLVSCTRCLSVRSCITLPQEDEKGSKEHAAPIPLTRRRPLPSLPKVTSSLDLNREHQHPRSWSLRSGPRGRYSMTESECESCRETVEDAPVKGLPVIVRKTLEKAEKTERGVYNSYPMRWLRYLLIPWSYPFALACSACERILEWIPNLPEDAKWLVQRLTEVVAFVMKEIETNSHLYSARFSCQLAVTEMNYSSPSFGKVDCCSWADDWSHPKGACEKHSSEIDFGFSLDMDKQLNTSDGGLSDDPVKRLTKMVRRESVTQHTFEANEFVSAAESAELAGIEACPRENMSEAGPAIVQFTKRHDALMSYYYLDENKKVNIFEIFGIDERTPETTRIQEIFGRSINRRHSFVNTVDAVAKAADAEVQGRDRASSLKLFKSTGALEEAAIAADIKEVRDACCSPIQQQQHSVPLRRKCKGNHHHTNHSSIPLLNSPLSTDSEEELFVPSHRRKPNIDTTESSAYEGSSGDEDFSCSSTSHR